ncbi:MAG: hypothetical protein AB8B62_15670 [Roseobacter sp.]
MTNDNKILTVSYGTFSCTLEGFDDSFETMKAIAEYFRDLASEDRYFGSEPPQPDAQMLAKIAAREGARHVDAREHQGRIMLKARRDGDIATGTHDPESRGPKVAQPPEKTVSGARLTVVSRQMEPEEQHDATALKRITDDLQETPYSPNLDSLPKTSEGSDSKPQKVEARTETAPTGTVCDQSKTPPEMADKVTYDPAAFFSGQDYTAADPSYAGGYEDESNATASIAPTSEILAESTSSQPVDGGEKPPTKVDGASLAYKLHRIRAVVSQKDKTAEGSFNTADRAPPITPKGHDQVSETTPSAETTAFVAEVAKEIADALNEDFEVARRDADQDSSDQLIRTITQEADAQDAQINLTADTSETENPDNLFSVADESAVDQTNAALENCSERGSNDKDGVLFSETGASTSIDNGGHLNGDSPPEQIQSPQNSRSDLPGLNLDAEKDVSRLMAKADQQMNEPESKTRRSAFSHLRAAVTVRGADSSIEDNDSIGEETAKVFKSDLDEVIKPRDEYGELSGTTRLPPLKLVAEQRVDTKPKVSRGPVAPRRVAASSDADLSLAEDSGFAEYASDRDAKRLPELLEAAAAYLTFMEGHDQFSRPQLMSRVRQADIGEFSREEGLRAFGQLLRKGKIEKIKGGRFTASEEIGYKPGHRAVS